MRPADLKEAVKKASRLINQLQINRQLSELKETLNTSRFEKIGLPVADGILFVKHSDIIFLQAEGMYTRFFTTHEGELLISKPLKHFVGLLEDHPEFYRTHRSYLINIKYIKQLVKRDGNHLIMDNDSQVSVSRDRQDALLEALNTF